MGIKQAIQDFPKQFEFKPVIENTDHLAVRVGAVVAGMGGSALTPDLLTAWDPIVDLRVHRGYGLPELCDLDGRLLIASSYSGNTEETLDAYDAARVKGMAVAAIAAGGTLLAHAERDGVPYIRLPSSGLQPRMALGYSILALAALLRHDRALEKLHALANVLDADALEEPGQTLAAALRERTPVFYASDRNAAIARYWKIACNETGKIPAFANVLPELNHNEMTGFDVGPRAREFLDRFHIVLLRDAEDHPRVARRMDVLAGLLQKRGVPVVDVALDGRERFERMFQSIIHACWTAFHLASEYGAEAEAVPMVEEFKQLMT